MCSGRWSSATASATPSGELLPERAAAPAAATRPSSREARASAPAHNLPSALTSFVGRTRELATIAAMLAEARLLTLNGPGLVARRHYSEEQKQ